MNKIIYLFSVLAVLVWAGTALAVGPYGTLVVRNQTDATMGITLDGAGTETKIPPRMVVVLEGYLPQGRTEVQVTAICVNGRPTFPQTYWVSGKATKSHPLVINPDNFGKSLMFDKPGCGVQREEAAVFGRCVEYAQKAVHQAAQAYDMVCPTKGDLWSHSPDKHLAWCLSASSGEAKANTKARAEVLAECESRQDKKPWCEEYAKAAVKQYQQGMVDNQCNFTSSLWSDAKGVHYQYCMEVSREEAQEAWDSRTKALEDCLQEPAREAFCKEYAATAMEQHQANLDMGCGYWGPLWHGNYTAHFEWCLGASAEEADYRTRGRKANLFSCAKKKDQNN